MIYKEPPHVGGSFFNLIFSPNGIYMNVKTMFLILMLMTAGCKVHKDIEKSKSHVDSTGIKSDKLANIASLHQHTLDSSRFASFANSQAGYQRQTFSIQFASLSNGQRANAGSDTTTALVNAAGSYLAGLPTSMLDRITGLTVTTETGKEEKQSGSAANQNRERVTDGRDSLNRQGQQSTSLSKDDQASTKKVDKTGLSLSWKIGIGLVLLAGLGLIVLGYFKGWWSIFGLVKKKLSNSPPQS